MKFVCPCGHLIRDQTDNLPHKASVRSDEDDGAFWDRLDAEILSALRACRDAQPGAVDGVISRQMEEVGMGLVLAERSMYECAACGRLFLQSLKGPGYLSYLPEDAERDVLTSYLKSPRMAAGPAPEDTSQ